MNTQNAILVWNAGQEPAEFAALGSNDDRDHVAFVPAHVTVPSWLDSGTAFGCCDVEQFAVDGGTVFVGFHA